MPDYSMLPQHMQEHMRKYIEDGVIPGDFLQAVICNQLVESFGKADDTNRQCMYDYVAFLYNEVSFNCWGSQEKMMRWIELGGLNGMAKIGREMEGDDEDDE